MSKNSTRSPKAATLAVDYTPGIKAAREEVKTAAAAYKRFRKTGDTKILPQCVEATRTAMKNGFLVDGRKDKDAAPGSVGKAEFGRMFDLSSGSEVTFWQRLAKCLDAGVTVGDDLWLTLATTRSGKPSLMAKATEVAKVIDADGSVAEIAAAVEAKIKAAGSRAANKPASAKGEGESAEVGITPSEDPVADAHLAILGLAAALKRIPVDSPAWGGAKGIRAGIQEVLRRENTLRKAKAVPAAPTGEQIAS